MVPKLPPLKSLRLFATVARCGSFKLAAQELNRTPGAVSHGIKSLEEWLNVELFDRKRELVLTPAGHHYLPYINEALSAGWSTTAAGPRWALVGRWSRSVETVAPSPQTPPTFDMVAPPSVPM